MNFEIGTIPIFWPSLYPTNLNPTAIIHACEKRAMASYELLKSDPVSPLVCVGMAFAICESMLSVLRGLVAMVGCGQSRGKTVYEAIRSFSEGSSVPFESRFWYAKSSM